jgi:hypothetical protein
MPEVSCMDVCRVFVNNNSNNNSNTNSSSKKKSPIEGPLAIKGAAERGPNGRG